ncbi:MAG: hypothetical protein MJ168_08030 [Clostridia bacterium]|nr:hypothetical protein [Clostridia bacterium]
MSATANANIKVRCKSCRESFIPHIPIDGEENKESGFVYLKPRKPVLKEGAKYYVTSYICPCCGELNVVQVDDELTIKTLDKIIRLAGCKLRGLSNGTLTEKAERRISREAYNLNAYLDSRRKKLYEKYTENHVARKG